MNLVNNDRCKIWSRTRVTICFCFFEGWQCLFLPLEQNPCESTGRGGRHVPLVGNGHLDGLLVPTSTGTTTLQFVRLAITSHQVTIVSEDPASSWLEAADHQPSHHDHVAVFTDWVFCLPARPTPAQPPPLLWGDVTPLCVCVLTSLVSCQCSDQRATGLASLHPPTRPADLGLAASRILFAQV